MQSEQAHWTLQPFPPLLPCFLPFIKHFNNNNKACLPASLIWSQPCQLQYAPKTRLVLPPPIHHTYRHTYKTKKHGWGIMINFPPSLFGLGLLEIIYLYRSIPYTCKADWGGVAGNLIRIVQDFFFVGVLILTQPVLGVECRASPA
jgi:hypothetical protein